MTPAQLIAEARTWLGTPFVANQSCKQVGADCIGMIAGAAMAIGMVIRYRSNYPQRPDGSLHKELSAQMLPVACADMRPGDVLTMDMSRDGGEPHHLALFTGQTIIHAYTQARKCVEQPYVDFWQKKVRRIYRFREFSE